MKKLLLFLYLSIPCFAQTTWYVRTDGGTRLQCDGKADAALASNGHCALKDYRMLYDDGTYGNSAWIIKGGDTVILRGGPYRVGFDTDGTKGNDPQCLGGPGTYNCTNPKIPAGTPNQHTKILGENFASCNKSNMTQLYGGHGLQATLNMEGAEYVDVGCIELTRHSQCIQSGPTQALQCSKDAPVDDYASNGILMDAATHDVNLTDMWIHGFTSRGIIGPIGGTVTALRVLISMNGGAGWDFDSGGGDPLGPGALWNFTNSTIEWSGCNQEYPAVDPIPVNWCYGQNNAGYGDGVGTPTGTGLNANITYSSFRYNVQDGLDLGHVDTGGPYTLTIANSGFAANGGGMFKWGPNYKTAVVANNYGMANCNRLLNPIPGTPASFNSGLTAGDMCRAGDAISFNFRQGGTAQLLQNTVVTYASNTLDVQCWDALPSSGNGSAHYPGQGVDGATDCSQSSLNIKGNIFLAYDNPVYDYNQSNGPGAIFFADTIGTVSRLQNTWYGMGHGWTCVSGEICASPQYIGQLPSFTSEAVFDFYNVVPTLSATSPSLGQGIITGVVSPSVQAPTSLSAVAN